MNTISPIVRLPTDVASAAVNPAPIPSGDTADAIFSLPMRPMSLHDSASATAAASPVIRGAAALSSQIQAASRVRQAVVIPGAGASSVMTATDRECSGIATHRIESVMQHAAPPANLSHDRDGSERHGTDAQNTNYKQIRHFHHSVSMTGVNTA